MWLAGRGVMQGAANGVDMRCRCAHKQVTNSCRPRCQPCLRLIRAPVRAPRVKPLLRGSTIGCQSHHSVAAPQRDTAPKLDRRTVFAGCLILTAWRPVASLAGPEKSEDLTEYVNSRQGYRLDRPSTWEQSGKAGADVLFADPANKSTTIGVTVNPIKIASLEQFGDVETVRKRLIATEKQKESTLDTTLVRENSRRGHSGTLIYDIEYELNSTRGRKRILSTVGIANKKLYIVNGNIKCTSEGCDGQDAGVATLRQVANTFDVV